MLALREQASVERNRQQRAEAMTSRLVSEVRENDLQVPAELPQDLAARPARRRGRIRIGDDGDPREGAMALGQRFEHGHTFRANGQAVGRVLDVAAGDDRPVGALERGADPEVREVGVGVQPCAARRLHEITLGDP